MGPFPQLRMDDTHRRVAYEVDENPQHMWPTSTGCSPAGIHTFGPTSYATDAFRLTGADSNAAYAATDARVDGCIDPALLYANQQKATSEALDSSCLNGMFAQFQMSSMASAFPSDISICSSPLSPLSSCHSYSECESIRSSSPYGSPESSLLYPNSPFEDLSLQSDTGPIETSSQQDLVRPYVSSQANYKEDQYGQGSFAHTLPGHLNQAEYEQHAAVVPLGVTGRTSPTRRSTSALGSQFNSENPWAVEDPHLANVDYQDTAPGPLSNGSSIFDGAPYATDGHFEYQSMPYSQADPSLHQLPVTAGIPQEVTNHHRNLGHVLSTIGEIPSKSPYLQTEAPAVPHMEATTEHCDPENRRNATDSKMILKKKQDLDDRTQFKCGNEGCDVECHGLVAINEHMKIAHGQLSKAIPLLFKCWWPGCGIWRKNFADMDRHEDHPHDSSVKDQGVRKCSFPGCEETYDEKNKGDLHYNEVHRDPERDYYPCLETHDGQKCDRKGFRSFRRPDHRKEHQKRMNKREEDKKPSKVSKSRHNPRPPISAAAVNRYMSGQAKTLSG